MNKSLKQKRYCVKCALSSEYPRITFDDKGVCSVCNRFESYKDEVSKYFRPYSEFKILMEENKKKNKYDCILLYSGGKDSSYVLYKLVEEGYKVLTFTFDNGFISEQAFKNIKRMTDKLGVDNIIMKHDRINEIFVEDLRENCTVCIGCFKVLTSLSTKLAIKYGVKIIISGLSRGQIFETKLKDLYDDGIYDVQEIEKSLYLFRKMYHKLDDKIADLMDIGVNSEVIDTIQFVDYYRYNDVKIKDIKKYLCEADEFWKLPDDTGMCSTNCLINDVGIYIHLKNKGYHNYAGPLNYDLRLDVSTREDVLQESELQPDAEKVERILQEIGYYDEEDMEDEFIVMDMFEEQPD